MHARGPCLRCCLSGAAPGRGEDAAGPGGGVGVAAGRRPTRPSSGSAAAAARAVRTAGPSPRPEPAPRLAAPTHGAARRGRRRPAAGTGAGPPHTRPLQLRDTRSACRHRPGPLGTPLHCAGEYRAQGRRAGSLFPGTPQTRVGLRPGRRRQISSRNLSGSLGLSFPSCSR